jgi:hypothetical protein
MPPHDIVKHILICLQIEIIICYAFFLAEMSDIECSNNMFKFKAICKRLGVPIAAEKNGRSCEKYGIIWID